LPGFDGTGPLGQGPFTGCGMGLCAVRLSDIKDPVILRALVERAGQGTYKLENTGKEVIRMPRGDGTGPMGFGPMTGRAAGYCAGYPVPGFMNPMGGGVAGMAYGYGAGPYMSAPGAYGYGMPAYGAGYGVGYAGRPYGGFGRGMGRGRGRGMGRGRGRW